MPEHERQMKCSRLALTFKIKLRDELLWSTKESEMVLLLVDLVPLVRHGRSTEHTTLAIRLYALVHNVHVTCMTPWKWMHWRYLLCIPHNCWRTVAPSATRARTMKRFSRRTHTLSGQTNTKKTPRMHVANATNTNEREKKCLVT